VSTLNPAARRAAAGGMPLCGYFAGRDARAPPTRPRRRTGQMDPDETDRLAGYER
jgi:hypothetical protein